MARPTKITGMDVTPFSGVKIQKVGAIYTRTLEEGGAIYSEKGVYIYIYIPVVPARGGAEVALKIYIRPFSSIELACAVRQRSPCVRALCETGVLFHMSHLKLHVTLHT